jgi:regulator of sirC expression with transglutaminase-like and TPR domain
MALSTALPTPLEYFASLVASDEDFPLLEAAASLAQDDHPELDVQQVLSEVDRLQVRLQRRIDNHAGPLQRLRAVNQFFYRDLNFSINLNHFDDPDNSLIHVILQTRRAVPLSLALLWLELAQSVGLKARGVCFPGHFMMKVNLPDGQVVLDPIDGHSLSREALLERLLSFRQSIGLQEELEMDLNYFLAAASPREIMTRMLADLKDIHTAHQDWRRLLAVQNRLLVLLPQAWVQYRDRGLMHEALGQAGRALEDLETYLFNMPHSPDQSIIAARVAALRNATAY